MVDVTPLPERRKASTSGVSGIAEVVDFPIAKTPSVQPLKPVIGSITPLPDYPPFVPDAKLLPKPVAPNVSKASSIPTQLSAGQKLAIQQLEYLAIQWEKAIAHLVKQSDGSSPVIPELRASYKRLLDIIQGLRG